MNRTGSIWNIPRNLNKSQHDASDKSFAVHNVGFIKCYIWMKKMRFVIMIGFYMVATFHLFFALIISNSNSEICNKYDVISDESRWYSSEYERWFQL